MTAEKTVEVVLPVHNELGNIPELLARFDALKARLPAGVKLRFLFVDDRSTDGSTELLITLASQRDDVRSIRLSGNFGHQAALTCGIDHARGDAVVLMDADLQDDPDAVPLLIQGWLSGSKVVLVQRGQRREGLLFRVLQAVFYRMYRAVSETALTANVGTFCLLDHAALTELRAYHERARYLPGLVARLGFSRTLITVDRKERHSGETRVGLLGQIRLGLNGIFAFSSAPLELVFWLGLALVSVLTTGALIIASIRVWTELAIPGWASTLAAILFLGGVQLFCTGLLGAYVARIYVEAKGRPIYHVEDEHPPRPDEKLRP